LSLLFQKLIGRVDEGVQEVFSAFRTLTWAGVRKMLKQNIQKFDFHEVFTCLYMPVFGSVTN